MFKRQANAELTDNVEAARARIYEIATGLAGLQDDNTIRFIAPLLAEHQEYMLGSDYGIPPIQEHAASALWRAVEQGMKIPGMDNPNGRRSWRQWWKENRQRYEPIPAALAALEASEGG